MSNPETVLPEAARIAAELAPTYRDLHKHPELAFQEFRTAGLAARTLMDLGFEVTEGIGQTGVVGVLTNGDGPTVLLRADMDALPVEERTGLDYASTDRATDASGADVPVMHACGHDVHVTALLGAAELLVGCRDDWSGTLIALFQPAEEGGGGAQAMIDDALFDKVPRPDVVLGQHVAPLGAGLIGLHPGPAFAATDAFEITLHGRGGHGSRPELTVDPVVLAAATVMRLQTVVSREIAGTETAVLTVGTLHAGTKNNIIADHATLGVNVRSYDTVTRDRVVEAMTRIVHAEAQASDAPREPDIVATESFPVLVNDPGASARTRSAFARVFGDEQVIDPGVVTGSEDVGLLATEAGVPLVYWLLGGAELEAFQAAYATGRLDALPSNHSPLFAPVIEPTLTMGVAALATAALEWLDERSLPGV
jgi:amidohydrolase